MLAAKRPFRASGSATDTPATFWLCNGCLFANAHLQPVSDVAKRKAIPAVFARGGEHFDHRIAKGSNINSTASPFFFFFFKTRCTNGVKIAWEEARR